MTIKIKLLFILLVFPILSLILVPIRNKAYAVECYFQENIGSGFCSAFDKSWCVKYTYNDPPTPSGCTQTYLATFTSCGAPNDSRCVTSPTSPPVPTSPPGCIGDPCPGNFCSGSTCTDCSGTIRGGTKSCTSGATNNSVPAGDIYNPPYDFDAATCTISGWTCDPDKYSQAIGVHFYEPDTSAGAAGLRGAVTANLTSSATVSGICGNTPNHNFSFSPPLRDGVSHTLSAYGINIDSNGALGGSNAKFTGGSHQGQITFTCATPACTVAPSTTTTCDNTGFYFVTASGIPSAYQVYFPHWGAGRANSVAFDGSLGNNMGEGTWNYLVDLSQHPGTGTLYTDVYVNNINSASYCGGTTIQKTVLCPTVVVPPPPVAPSPTPTDSPVPTLTPIPPSTSPTPSNLACDVICQSNSQCVSNYCFQFACRNIACETDNTCLCSSPSLTPTGEVTPTPTDGVTPTPTDGVTPTPTDGVTPTETPTPTGVSPACICDTDFTCSSECSFDLQAGDPRIQYNTPIACKLRIQGDPLPNIALQWCNNPKRTLGDADGDGQIGLTDYHWYRRMVKIRRGIPADINADFNGDGEVGSLDGVIILKTLNKL